MRAVAASMADFFLKINHIDDKLYNKKNTWFLMNTTSVSQVNTPKKNHVYSPFIDKKFGKDNCRKNEWNNYIDHSKDVILNWWQILCQLEKLILSGRNFLWLPCCDAQQLKNLYKKLQNPKDILPHKKRNKHVIHSMLLQIDTQLLV